MGERVAGTGAAPAGGHRASTRDGNGVRDGIPAFDGLRGLAALLVVGSRLGGSPVGTVLEPLATAGVAIFFVMSGFLVTGLLAREQRRHGQVSLSAFFARRALRLIPALVVAVAAGIVLGIAAGRDPLTMLRDGVAALVFVANVRNRFGRLGGPLDHLWTLSMVAQYYVVWPVIVVAARTWKWVTLERVALTLGVASLLARLATGVDEVVGWSPAPVLPHLSVYALLLGSAAALWTARQPRRVVVPPWLCGGCLAATVLVVAGAGWTAVGLDREISLAAGTVVGPAAAVAAVGVLIAVTTGSRGVPRWLSWSPLRSLGTVSYGLYLWHGILSWTIGVELGNDGLRGALVGGGSALLALGLAIVSRQLVEEPFLRRRRRFVRARLTPSAPRPDRARKS